MEVESPKAPHFRHVLNDGFVPRLGRAFMSSMDGQRTWRKLESRVGDENPQCHFRLNVALDKVPLLDDANCMDKMRATVRGQIDISSEYIELAAAILTASLYFELDSHPEFEAGTYRCEGSILCRNNAESVIRGLHKLNRPPSRFSCDKGHLADFGGLEQICNECRNYSKKVAFYVNDLRSLFTIFLDVEGGQRRRISGFPQTPQWFVDRQRFDAPFGHPGAVKRLERCRCRTDSPKRRASNQSPRLRPKKRQQLERAGANYF